MMKISVDNKVLSQALKQVELAGADMRPLMRVIAGTLATETALNFEEEGRPAWLPSLAAQERNGMTLSASGHLRRSITTQYDSHSAQIGTNVDYGRIHQLGGEIKHAARETTLHFRQHKDGTVGKQFVKKHNSNFTQTATIGEHSQEMPARPYLPVTSDGELQPGVEQKLLRNVLNHLEQAAKS